MSEQNKALIRRWFEEVWNQGRESTIDELLHPQGKSYGFPEPASVLIGPEGFKAIHRAFHNAYGNIHIDIDEILAEAEYCRHPLDLHHDPHRRRPRLSRHRKKVSLPGSSFVRCRDGKLAEGWNFMDLTKTTQQLQSA